MKIQEAAENYLETILILQQANGRVRAVDIAHHMHYSKPTVSVILRKFRENGYVETAADGSICLTDKGYEIAERTYERHRVIAQLLMAAGVDEETAFADACKIEHAISETSFLRIKEYYAHMKETSTL